MKKLRYVICIAIFVLLFSIDSITVSAYSQSKLEEQIDLNSLIDSLPEEAKKYLPTSFKNTDDILKEAQNTDSNFLVKTIFGILKGLLPSVTKKFYSLVGLIITVSLVNSIKNTIATDGYSKAVSYITMAVISIFIFNLMTDVWANAEWYFSSINASITALIPVMTLLYTMGGNISTAVVNSSGLAIMLTILNTVIKSFMLPLTKICFGLTIAGGVGNIKGISEITKYIKNFFTVTLSGIMTVFSIFLLFKTNLSASADGAAARTIKFAGSFIPIIGSALGESVRSLMSGLNLIKSSVGFIGIVIIIVITLPTLFNILTTKMCIDLSVVIASILDCKKESQLLKEFSGLLAFFLAISLCTAVLFVFELTVFVLISPALGAT